MFKNEMKAKLKKGEAVFGTFFNSYSPDIAEIIGAAGVDFIVIDCEHGPGSPEGIVDCIRASEARGMTPIVRVTEDTRTGILRYLDIGAHGILVPQLKSVEQAKEVVRSSKYAPEGMRGMAVPRASTWGLDGHDYTKMANEETFISVQCENVECLENIEEIAKVEGIDMIFLGPYDMSQALGIPGQIKHEKMLEAEKRILNAAKSAGIAAGIFVGSVEAAKQSREEGWDFLLTSMDIQTVGQVYSERVKEFKR